MVTNNHIDNNDIDNKSNLIIIKSSWLESLMVPIFSERQQFRLLFSYFIAVPFCEPFVSYNKAFSLFFGYSVISRLKIFHRSSVPMFLRSSVPPFLRSSVPPFLPSIILLNDFAACSPRKLSSSFWHTSLIQTVKYSLSKEENFAQSFYDVQINSTEIFLQGKVMDDC